ncbi:hypothetical protein OUZ56_028651 [Daphnia magna]|uniref:Uncharacterized protein n=1 Tax=Daphnia magna TaxID=35525 RepID=A0ABR0B4H5_9CRUS|nr:hypothetical protein OUZ56_028651 [Daphnia magna]
MKKMKCISSLSVVGVRCRFLHPFIRSSVHPSIRSFVHPFSFASWNDTTAQLLECRPYSSRTTTSSISHKAFLSTKTAARKMKCFFSKEEKKRGNWRAVQTTLLTVGCEIITGPLLSSASHPLKRLSSHLW